MLQRLRTWLSSRRTERRLREERLWKERQLALTNAWLERKRVRSNRLAALARGDTRSVGYWDARLKSATTELMRLELGR